MSVLRSVSTVVKSGSNVDNRIRIRLSRRTSGVQDRVFSRKSCQEDLVKSIGRTRRGGGNEIQKKEYHE